MHEFREAAARFRSEVFPRHRQRFAQLARGQQPQVLFVTCADSRIDPSLLTGADPGELFVLRNAGNIVPPAGTAGSGEAATVEYAVRVLGVRHIVVCGHSHCGAMAALRAPETAAGLATVPDWLIHSRPALDRLVKSSGQNDLDTLIRTNVLLQLDHLRSWPWVAQAERSGHLHLHGWFYRFEEGEVSEFVPQEGRFRQLRPSDEPIERTSRIA